MRWAAEFGMDPPRFTLRDRLNVLASPERIGKDSVGRKEPSSREIILWRIFHFLLIILINNSIICWLNLPFRVNRFKWLQSSLTSRTSGTRACVPRSVTDSFSSLIARQLLLHTTSILFGCLLSDSIEWCATIPPERFRKLNASLGLVVWATLRMAIQGQFVSLISVDINWN